MVVSQPRPSIQPPHRILVVDDHPLFRAGLVGLMSHESDLDVCGEAHNAAQALDAIKLLNPDLAIVDIGLPDKNGLELLKDIQALHPGVDVLIISMHAESLYAERVLRAGASGYVMKQEATEKVIIALRQIFSGSIYLSDKLSARLMHQLVGGGRAVSTGLVVDQLSDRELEVFGLIGQGRGTRQIAEQLHLSVKTIESHRAHIKEKLSLNSATELVHRAVQMRSEQAF